MKTLLIVRGLHPPWATGAVSYGRGLLSSLLQIPQNEVSVISTLENHRLARILNPQHEDWTQVQTFKGETVNYVQLRGSSQRELKSKVLGATKLLDSSESFDVIHVVYQGLTPFEISLHGSVSKKSLLVKHIYGPSSSYFNASVTNLIYKAGFFTGLSNAMVSFPSYYSASTYWMSSSKNRIIIPPAIDTNLFMPRLSLDTSSLPPIFAKTREKFGIENLLGKSKIILYVGFLAPQRFPYQLMLRAFQKMLRMLSSSDICFLIIGRQNEIEYGEKMTASDIINVAKKMGLEKHIGVALHELSDFDKSSLISACDVLVYPFTTSRLNPSVVDPPLGILEAMALGKKVLANKVLSIPDVIGNKFNGFLFDDLDVDTISTSLTMAIDAGSEIGKKARETIIQRFSLRTVADILGKITIQS